MSEFTTDDSCGSRPPILRCPTCGSERPEVRLIPGLFIPCDNEAFHAVSRYNDSADSRQSEPSADGMCRVVPSGAVNRDTPPDLLAAAHEAIDNIAASCGQCGGPGDDDLEANSRIAAHAALDAAVEDAFRRGQEAEHGK